MESVEIQGIKVSHRSKYEDELVLFSQYEEDEQFFRRMESPFTDDELVAIANREHQYTTTQAKWKETEEKRFEDGVYISIKGEEKYLPGAYWCYINYWTLEHGDKPEYREDDRLFFLLHEYLRISSNCLGITRLKGRRQGATSIAMFFMWFVGGRKEHQLCGLTSFNDSAAQDAFQKMFMYGLKAMLPCFQADFDSDSENFIRFVKPVDKKKKGILAIKREGLNSYCDYKSNVINSYDSGRQSYNVPDESGKRNKLNINSYWSRLYKTFLVGSNKVGFGYLPTTVGSKNEGGENYRIFWKNANQYEKNKDTGETVGIDTVNRVVGYFVPATYCYAGCIDKFGYSVVEDPSEPILSNEGKWITEGSKTIILRERARLSGEQLMEHRRDYPLDVHDAFAFETGSCEFNEVKIIEQLTSLEINPVFLRRVRFFETKKIVKAIIPGKRDKTETTVQYMDDDSANWLLFEEPKEKNKFTAHNGIFTPKNTLNYCIGVDMFKIGFSEHGSKGTICVFKKSCSIGGEETGNYPVAMYVGRPKLVQHLYDEVIKACLFYGCKVNFEIDAGDFFYGYFYERDMSDFLYWTPARNVNKPNQMLKPGTESANPYEIAQQLECAKIYLDGNDPHAYNGNIHRVVFPELLQQAIDYNHSERTPYDIMISLMMALLPALKVPDNNMPANLKPMKLLPTYKIKQYA